MLGDVVLPPWARGSADEFIRRNAEALECDAVSANLHHWIDLIFGAAQRGPLSEASLNVFYHLTYEGSVDLEAVTDPVQRKALADQILCFGQTPSQLFKKKHPQRSAPLRRSPSVSGAPRALKLACVVAAAQPSLPQASQARA